MPRISLALLPTLAVAGCTSADVLRLDLVPRPKRSPSAIEIIIGTPPVGRPYDLIAFVAVANRTAFGASSQKYVNRLRKEAAKLGGDAVVIHSTQDRVVGANAFSTPYGVAVNAKRQVAWQAAVIVWR